MMWEDINKRKFPRAKYKCLIRVLGGKKTKPVEAVTENISSGGMCVVLNVNIGLFKKVSLEVFLGTEKKAVSCAGVVVWVVKDTPWSSQNSLNTIQALSSVICLGKTGGVYQTW